ncbi:hypothetical protein DCAR_0415211 [Daucus carota subsp. sativus]|uniref:Uncharacterized protein n=1 Tax=Daucus carota subsp. sativus TaxID=79200 RepID=A0A165A8R5_DAUCS|nr:hypothetical protein DCAR_0415211 [Daucus carota subsp. sativus]
MPKSVASSTTTTSESRSYMSNLSHDRSSLGSSSSLPSAGTSCTSASLSLSNRLSWAASSRASHGRSFSDNSSSKTLSASLLSNDSYATARKLSAMTDRPRHSKTHSISFPPASHHQSISQVRPPVKSETPTTYQHTNLYQSRSQIRPPVRSEHAYNQTITNLSHYGAMAPFHMQSPPAQSVESLWASLDSQSSLGAPLPVQTTQPSPPDFAYHGIPTNTNYFLPPVNFDLMSLIQSAVTSVHANNYDQTFTNLSPHGAMGPFRMQSPLEHSEESLWASLDSQSSLGASPPMQTTQPSPHDFAYHGIQGPLLVETHDAEDNDAEDMQSSPKSSSEIQPQREEDMQRLGEELLLSLTSPTEIQGQSSAAAPAPAENNQRPLFKLKKYFRNVFEF